MFDCGPAATANLIHGKPVERELHGLGFRFTHISLIYNRVCGPCPFNIDSIPYQLPFAMSVDPQLLGLAAMSNPA